MRLAHLSQTARLTPYTHGLDLQSRLVQRHVDYRAFLASSTASSDQVGDASAVSALACPDPVILTLQHQPTYTIGRRELGKLPQTQQDFLTDGVRAAFHESPRGGQITYHAPGQLVVYPILSLRAHSLTPRCYVALLENVVISTISRFGVQGITTENPGVWLPGGDRKVASIGVNVRRGITGHGVAVNVEDRRGLLGWGFARIVACGLAGKEMTWLEREGGKFINHGSLPSSSERDDDDDADSCNLQVSAVERTFVEEFTKALKGVDGTYRVSTGDFGSL